MPCFWQKDRQRASVPAALKTIACPVGILRGGVFSYVGSLQLCGSKRPQFEGGS